MKSLKKIRKNRRGQGMTEYIIIVALIAIAAIGVITVFGNNIRRLFGASANALTGAENVSTGAQSVTNQMNMRKTLKSFGQNGGT